VLVRTIKEFVDDEMPTYASALAYQMLFSLFPFLLFLIALIGFLHLPDFFSWLRLQSELVLPPQALEQVNPVIDQLQQSKGGLLSVGIVIALWTASAGVRLMMSAMNAAYDVVEGRPAWKRVPLSIFYTVGVAGMLAVMKELQPDFSCGICRSAMARWQRSARKRASASLVSGSSRTTSSPP